VLGGAPVRVGEQAVEEIVNVPQASLDAVYAELLEVSESEKFYEELRTVLSNNYLPPNYSFESEPEQVLFSTVDLLKYPRIVIVGPAGSGKTSLVRRLAFDLDSKFLEDPEADRVTALYFKLRDFGAAAYDLPKAITKKEESIGVQFIPLRSKRGQLLYIFDGLDELNMDTRNHFVSWIKEFSTQQVSVRMIITTREVPLFSDYDLSDFKKLTIRPFNADQIVEYCYRYFGSKELAGQFYDQIGGNPRLVRLLSNPLTLSLSLALYAVRKLLPYNTGELIQELVVHLTERWDEKRGIQRYRLLSARAVRLLLGRLAYRLHSNGDFIFNEKILIGLIPFEYEGVSTEDILQEVRAATGLLHCDEKRWSFTHRYFQDFFCASYIIERVGGILDEYNKFNTDKNWATVWRYVGELCSDPELYIKIASDDGRGPVYHLDKLMPICLAEDRVGNDALALLLNIARKNLRLLADELKKVVFSRSCVRVTLRKESISDAETLASFLLNFYHLSRVPRSDLSRKMYRSVKEKKLGSLLKRVINCKSVPTIVVLGRTVRIHLR
jgi:NACHT domain